MQIVHANSMATLGNRFRNQFPFHSGEFPVFERDTGERQLVCLNSRKVTYVASKARTYMDDIRWISRPTPQPLLLVQGTSLVIISMLVL